MKALAQGPARAAQSVQAPCCLSVPVSNRRGCNKKVRSPQDGGQGCGGGLYLLSCTRWQAAVHIALSPLVALLWWPWCPCIPWLMMLLHCEELFPLWIGLECILGSFRLLISYSSLLSQWCNNLWWVLPGCVLLCGDKILTFYFRSALTCLIFSSPFVILYKISLNAHAY